MTHQSSSDVLSTFVRRFWLVLLGLILGGALGALVSLLTPQVYQSSAYLLVVPATEDVENLRPEDYTRAYSNLVTAPAITGEAVAEGEGDVDPQNMESAISVEVSPSNPLFSVTASSSASPEDAATLANSVGDAVASYTEDLSEDTGYRADVVAEAPIPTTPVRPNWGVNIAVGAALGLLLGGIVALLWDNPFRTIALLWGDMKRWIKGLGEQRQTKRIERQAKRIDDLEKTLERLRGSSSQKVPQKEEGLHGTEDQASLENDRPAAERSPQSAQRVPHEGDERQEVEDRPAVRTTDKT